MGTMLKTKSSGNFKHITKMKPLEFKMGWQLYRRRSNAIKSESFSASMAKFNIELISRTSNVSMMSLTNEFNTTGYSRAAT